MCNLGPVLRSHIGRDSMQSEKVVTQPHEQDTMYKYVVLRRQFIHLISVVVKHNRLGSVVPFIFSSKRASKSVNARVLRVMEN